MNADKLVMLLSTDWFFPHWAAIQIELPDTTRVFSQQGCREITKVFIGDADDYYLVSFAQSRLDETRLRFFALLADANVPVESIDRMGELISVDHDSGSAHWMLTTTTKMLVSGHQDLPVGETIPSLHPQIVDMVTEWDNRQPERFDFGRLCLSSTTAWDRYIAALTPRTPAALESYLQVGLIAELEFRDLRSTFASMTDEQRNSLKEWYVAVSRRLTGADHVTDGIIAAFEE